MPHPPPKSSHVGEIGWGVPKEVDYSLLKSDHQIKVPQFQHDQTCQPIIILFAPFLMPQLKTFRQALEDNYTHRYQEPYYPPPQRTIKSKETQPDASTKSPGRPTLT